jgi:hypothetical protein
VPEIQQQFERGFKINVCSLCRPLNTNGIYAHKSASGAATLRLRLLPNKMAVTVLFVFIAVAGLAAGHNINLQNNLRYRIWPGIKGNRGKGQPDNRGFALDSGERVSKGLLRCRVACGLQMGRNYTEANRNVVLCTIAIYSRVI